jgi:hypothetical protein
MSKKASEGPALTEAVSDEKISISTETVASSEKIAERKTIVYETRADPTVIKVAAEKLKVQLFGRFGFLKPKAGDIQFVSIDKYYEPYMVINGRYFVDYYRKCAYTVNVGKEVQEVILLDHRFDLGQLMDPSAKDHNVIRLEGEERLINEVKASLIVDRFGDDVTLEELPSAPSERHPKKTLRTFGVEQIARDADLDLIRSRIVRRPGNISRLVEELFEVDERAVIYTPRFRVAYRNVRTNEEKAVEFDGVTAQKIQQSKNLNEPLPPPPPP